jgi:hypothetical protein
MEPNLMKTGKAALSILLLAVGACLSISLYIGIMPAHAPSGAGFADVNQPPSSWTALLQNNQWIKPVLMFAVMLAGMFFNQVFENLKEQKKEGVTRVKVFRLLADGFSGITFWMAVFVSPLIFYGTYYMVDKLPDGIVGYFYAFQGGFFWYNIFSRLELKSKK